MEQNCTWNKNYGKELTGGVGRWSPSPAPLHRRMHPNWTPPSGCGHRGKQGYNPKREAPHCSDHYQAVGTGGGPAAETAAVGMAAWTAAGQWPSRRAETVEEATRPRANRRRGTVDRNQAACRCNRLILWRDGKSHWGDLYLCLWLGFRVPGREGRGFIWIREERSDFHMETERKGWRVAKRVEKEKLLVL